VHHRCRWFNRLLQGTATDYQKARKVRLFLQRSLVQSPSAQLSQQQPF
jgi:hypothetical protein